MNLDYRTPKRRHSSLFQRMEEQIEKISRKLSAAKSTARQSSYDKVRSINKTTKIQTKDKLKQFKSIFKQNMSNIFQSEVKNPRKNIHFDDRRHPSVIQTVRIKHNNEADHEYSPYSGKKTMTSKTINRRLNFASYRQKQDQRIQNLQQQNIELSYQIKKLQNVCQDQSYRMGYCSAQFRDKMNQMQQKNKHLNKQNIYLKKLCEHYKLQSYKLNQ